MTRRRFVTWLFTERFPEWSSNRWGSSRCSLLIWTTRTTGWSILPTRVARQNYTTLYNTSISCRSGIMSHCILLRSIGLLSCSKAVRSQKITITLRLRKTEKTHLRTTLIVHSIHYGPIFTSFPPKIDGTLNRGRRPCLQTRISIANSSDRSQTHQFFHTNTVRKKSFVNRKSSNKLLVARTGFHQHSLELELNFPHHYTQTTKLLQLPGQDGEPFFHAKKKRPLSTEHFSPLCTIQTNRTSLCLHSH